MTFADINPITGQVCGGTFNRNTGGGIPDYTTCTAPTNPPATTIAYVTATAEGTVSNPIPIFVHPVVTSVVIGNPTAAAACTTTTDPFHELLPDLYQHRHDSVHRWLPLPGRDRATDRARLPERHHQPRRQHYLPRRSHRVLRTELVIFTVDQNGVATAQQPGSTIVTSALTNSGTGGAAGFFATCPPASITLTVPSSTTPLGPINVGVNNTQSLTATVVDTNGVQLQGTALTFLSTTPTTITAGNGVVSPSFPGTATITAVCQPPGCNPAPFSQIGLYGNGKPVTSNGIQATAAGTNATVLYIASTQSQFLQPVDFALNQQGALLKLPYFPNSMVISQDGSTLYLGSTTALMTVATGTTSLNRREHSDPGDRSFDFADGGTVVVTDPVRQTVSLVVGGSVSSTYGGVGTHAQWSPDSATVYVTTNTNTLLEHSSFTGWNSTPTTEQYTDLTVAVPSIGAFFAPVRDRYKVYIIDEAHMVTTAAFNALLKLVEEPPDFLVFVFATTEPDKVLTTIRSRTHHYPFRLIPPQALRTHLEHIVTAEGISVEPAVLPLVVRAGGGSARDSLSILDQLLAGAGPTGVTYTRAVALLGVTDDALLDDMIDALAAGDAGGVYGTVEKVVEAGHDPRRFSVDLLDRFRDLILLDAVPDAGERGLINVPQDQLTHMSDQATRLGGATLTRYAEIVHTALIEMRGTTSPRLVLELLCARMMLPDATTDSASLLQRLERLERRMTVSGETPQALPLPAAKREPAAVDSRASDEPVAPVVRPVKQAPPPSRLAAKAAPAAPTTPAETAPEPVETAPEPAVTAPEPAATAPEPVETAPVGELDAAALRRLWPETLEVVKQASRRTRALLDNAQITEVAGELVTLSAPGALAKMIAEDSNTSVLRAALTKVVGGEWKVAVSGAAPAAAPEPAQRGRGAEPDPRDDADFDPGPSDERATVADSTAAPDPETEALKLLRDQLGARPLDG